MGKVNIARDKLSKFDISDSSQIMYHNHSLSDMLKENNWSLISISRQLFISVSWIRYMLKKPGELTRNEENRLE